LQRHPGDPRKRLRPREYPRHDGGGGGDLGAADPAVPGLPQQDHGGRFERRHQGMKHRTRPAALLLAACMAGALLTGCHGSREQAAFTVPDSFDASRDYEITFWAKNDTNKTQTDIY